MTETVAEKCSHCGNIIWPNDLFGRWQEQIVCEKCHAKLTSGMSSSGKAASTLSYSNALVTPPAYRAVRIAGTLHIILGWITIIIGVLLCSLGVIALFVEGNGIYRLLGGTTIFYGFMFLVAGIFALGFGQLLHCIRDMARNSFYLKRFSV